MIEQSALSGLEFSQDDSAGSFKSFNYRRIEKSCVILVQRHPCRR
jgi:hypothetical protein